MPTELRALVQYGVEDDTQRSRHDYIVLHRLQFCVLAHRADAFDTHSGRVGQFRR